jgi:hypothetical protein
VGVLQFISTTGQSAVKFDCSSVQIEKSLQTSMEQNTVDLIDVTFFKYKRDQVKVKLDGYLKTFGN